MSVDLNAGPVADLQQVRDFVDGSARGTTSRWIGRARLRLEDTLRSFA